MFSDVTANERRQHAYAEGKLKPTLKYVSKTAQIPPSDLPSDFAGGFPSRKGPANLAMSDPSSSTSNATPTGITRRVNATGPMDSKPPRFTTEKEKTDAIGNAAAGLGDVEMPGSEGTAIHSNAGERARRNVPPPPYES